MLLAFDIGNSGISFAVIDLSADKTQIVMKSSIASAPVRSTDEYVVLILDILRLHGIAPERITNAAVSSVVPQLTDLIADAACTFTKHRPLVVGPGVRTGLNIRVDMQTQLGADIVSNAVAAQVLTSAPTVVVDVGTATTITAIDSSGTLAGTVICPGLLVSANALCAAASQLGETDFTYPANIIGKNTHDAVNSGVINGHAYMIDGFVREFRALLCDASSDTKLSLLSTGGLAHLVVSHCRNKFHTEDALTLLGVAEIFKRNQKILYN